MQVPVASSRRAYVCVQALETPLSQRLMSSRADGRKPSEQTPNSIGVSPRLDAATISVLGARDSASNCMYFLLELLDSEKHRLDALRAQDTHGWSAFHYAARSGLFDQLPWHALGEELQHVPINLLTSAGHTMLQLAIWNEHASAVSRMLGDIIDPTSGERTENPWLARVKWNEVNNLACGRYGELDLALMRNQTNCARVLLRRKAAGVYACLFVCITSIASMFILLH